MNREQAYKILTEHLKNKNLIKHCLACEAAMRGLCVHFDPDASTDEIEKWGITGLLHDADYEETADTPERHGLLITEQVKLPEDIGHAINSHNFQNTKVDPISNLDWSITCCDQLTGLIVAATLISPSKKLADITPDFVLKRFGEKSFAKGADRTVIGLCEEKLDIKLPEFVEIVLYSMQKISQELGL
ncbi:MAG TPA: HD domain-containing protein [Patescibacteria group bacterium]|nr:HD domain-containing protein [Patescibacteria group bacterium]